MFLYVHCWTPCGGVLTLGCTLRHPFFFLHRDPAPTTSAGPVVLEALAAAAGCACAPLDSEEDEETTKVCVCSVIACIIHGEHKCSISAHVHVAT